MAEKLKKSPYFVKPYKQPGVGATIIQHYDFSVDEKQRLVVVPTEKEDIQKSINSHRDEVGLVNVIKLATAKGIDPMAAPFANKASDSLPSLPEFETWDDVEKSRKDALKALAEISKKLGISPSELTKATQKGQVKDLAEAKLTKKAESEVKDNG